MHTRCIVLTVSFMLLLTTHAFAQDKALGTVVTQLDKEIWRVFQARNGDYWFGSPKTGLYRYDGKKLINYTAKDGIGYNHISGIMEDQTGHLLVTTSGDYDKNLRQYQGALKRYDGKAFTAVKMLDRDASVGAWKFEPAERWFDGDTGTLSRFDGKTMQRVAMPTTKEGDAFVAAHPRSKYPNIKTSPYAPYVIYHDSHGHVWIGTANLGVCRYDGKTFAWLPDKELRNGSFGTRSIIEDKDGTYWFCDSLQRYTVDGSDPASPRFKKVEGLRDPKDTKKPLIEGIISAVKDNNGDLWLATYGDGMWRYDGKTATRYPVKEGDKETTVITVYQDRKGVIWLGTHTAGAQRFNGKEFEQFRP